ncbi:MAG: gamma carbonic anhydrase family protein [Candidatus Marinimicrobia bacterium]|nr:gamma carbonic anhydrase family protein [Candidatus Neomarinimicrobiota bacterium]MDD5582805.1 gamma carbonic anhydrase family protein [Candidatus Neomarinimicrobiota bacterium]
MILPHHSLKPSIHPKAFILPETTLIGDVTIGEASSIWFQSVLRGDIHFIRIGKRSNLQDGVLVHTGYSKYPTIIGDDVTIGHRAIIHGTEIQNTVLIGMGAILLNGSLIEEGAIVAAGAVVRENFTVPSRTMVAGIPAKVIREVSDEEYQKIKQSADHYCLLAETYPRFNY